MMIVSEFAFFETRSSLKITSAMLWKPSS